MKYLQEKILILAPELKNNEHRAASYTKALIEALSVELKYG